jgi:hypothetical protein
MPIAIAAATGTPINRSVRARRDTGSPWVDLTVVRRSFDGTSAQRVVAAEPPIR